MKIKREELIINTIAFKEELDRGVKQEDLLESVKDLGLSRVEIRREFLGDIDVELKNIRKKADQLGLSLFYSVNEDFVIGDRVNPKLKALRQEAELMGAPFVKLNTGDAGQISVASLAELAPSFQSSVGLKLENNQDSLYASIKNCRLMMNKVRAADLPIAFVFDLGNWAWLGEDIEQAFASLAEVTDYLHCKNYRHVNGQVEIASLFEGELDIPSLMKRFRHVRYLALEYPTSLENLEADIARLLEK